jgi:hypothetical protein
VRVNGRVFEAIVSRLEHRPACALYHSALVVHLDGERFVIESAPVVDGDGAARGVVAEGPVGARLAGRFRIFRYELRRWRGGVIDDADEAVDSPRQLTTDPAVVRRLLEVVAEIPVPVWGRDELGAGEMWNSNSMTAWVLVRSGIDTESLRPPEGGRAPGWDAGLVVARRSATEDL